MSRFIAAVVLLATLAGCAHVSMNSPPDLAPIAGNWRATLDGRFHLDLDIRPDHILITDGDIDNDITVYPHEYSVDGSTFSFAFDHSPFMPPTIQPPTPGHGVFTMTATLKGGALTGTGTRADGKPFTWTATKINP